MLYLIYNFILCFIILVVKTYQEDERGVPDESDGSGQLTLVPSAVSASWFVCILGQLQLF